MKNLHTHNTGFTLVELIVSITIFSMIITAVVSIFLFSSQMSTRVELNRAMQENIKNVVEDMAEEVRIGGIEGVIPLGQSDTSCNSSSSGAMTSWFKVCMNSGVEYVLGYMDESLGTWRIISDVNECSIPTDANPDTYTCRILKRYTPSDDYFPLTNSFIAFENINFVVTNPEIPKLTLVLTLRPSAYKWLSREIVERNTLTIQTTISERLIKTQ